jgi:hypothetical protein
VSCCDVLCWFVRVLSRSVLCCGVVCADAPASNQRDQPSARPTDCPSDVPTDRVAIFNFNTFQGGGSVCVAPMSDLQRLATGLWVPLVAVVFLLVNCLIHCIAWRCAAHQQWCCHKLHCPDRCVNSESIHDLGRIPSVWLIIRKYRRTLIGFAASACKSLACLLSLTLSLALHTAPAHSPLLSLLCSVVMCLVLCCVLCGCVGVLCGCVLCGYVLCGCVAV